MIHVLLFFFFQKSSLINKVERVACAQISFMSETVANATASSGRDVSSESWPPQLQLIAGCNEELPCIFERDFVCIAKNCPNLSVYFCL